MREQYPLGFDEPEDGLLSPQWVIQKIGEMSGPEAVFAAGVGQYQMWATQFIKYERPNAWLNSGGAGTMGYAVPAAMGAKVAEPDRLVWAIDGDDIDPRQHGIEIVPPCCFEFALDLGGQAVAVGVVQLHVKGVHAAQHGQANAARRDGAHVEALDVVRALHAVGDVPAFVPDRLIRWYVVADQGEDLHDDVLRDGN